MPTGRANRGEWGEPYVAFHLLGSGKIYIADAEGFRNPNEWMNIIEVIRQETSDRLVKYHYKAEDTMIDITVNGTFITSVPASDFLRIANLLAAEVISSTGRSFTVSDSITDFMQRVEMLHMKAKSVEKSDIFLTVFDPRASITREHIGFSIKTKFGQNPTLFNTAKASAAKYKLSNMTARLMDEVNSLTDDRGNAAVLGRCNLLRENGCGVEYVGFQRAERAGCEAFRENLEMLNPRLPIVIQRILWNHFFGGQTETDISDVVRRIIREDPCNVSRPEIDYPYMMKAFLYAAYCGMTASTPWNGISNVNGGFITVSDSGEVLAHYALESEAFKGYLYNNCYLEFPSTSRGHGDYAKVYLENGNYYFNLNFQIRYR